MKRAVFGVAEGTNPLACFVPVKKFLPSPAVARALVAGMGDTSLRGFQDNAASLLILNTMLADFCIKDFLANNIDGSDVTRKLFEFFVEMEGFASARIEHFTQFRSASAAEMIAKATQVGHAQVVRREEPTSADIEAAFEPPADFWLPEWHPNTCGNGVYDFIDAMRETDRDEILSDTKREMALAKAAGEGYELKDDEEDIFAWGEDQWMLLCWGIAGVEAGMMGSL